MPTQGNT